MRGKRKTLIGYGVLIVISALFLTRFLHYRTLYETLAENLVLPAEGAPAGEVPAPEPEPDLRAAGEVLEEVLYDPTVVHKIIRPAVLHALKTESVNIEAALGATLPESYWERRASDILFTISRAATHAKFGLSPAELFAEEAPDLERRVKELRALAEMTGTKDPLGYLKKFGPLCEAVNRRLEERDHQPASPASEAGGQKQE